MAWNALMYNPADSALAALDIAALMMFDVLMTAPLLGGLLTFDDMKKFPPALLRTPTLLNYNTSLCIANTMSDFCTLRWCRDVLQHSQVVC